MTRALLLILTFLGAGCAVKAPVYGLRPEYPEPLKRRWGSEAVFPRVDSTRPELRWEAFPPRDAAGLSVSDATLAKARQVVYDLKLYSETNGAPDALLEEHSSLPEPRYQFQRQLPACARFFWSVRACFQLDGRAEATEWGVIQSPNRDRWVPVVPDPGYYRFQTPCGARS